MKHKPVHELFASTAERADDRTAVECGLRSYTYASLLRAAESLSGQLVKTGMKPGEATGIMTTQTANTLISILATLRVGGVFVPLDHRLPVTRLANMIGQTEIKRIIADERLSKWEELTAGTDLTVLRFPDCGDAWDQAHGTPPPPSHMWLPDDFCYVYFTSGSTGTPKGIMGRLKAIGHFIRWQIETFQIDEDARFAQLTTPSFDAFLRDIFTPLCAGGVVCVPPSPETVLDPDGLGRWLAEQRVTAFHCVPSLLRSFLAGVPGDLSLPHLKTVFLAGEPLLPRDIAAWQDRFGTQTELINLYGPSETTMTKFCYRVTPEDRKLRTIPIGQPIRGARAMVLDPKGKPCRPMSIGEIYIRTPYRSLGYLGQPEATAAAFVRNPFSDDPKEVIYKTGDYGRVLQDGNFECLGRMDNQIKRNGVRIELGEIEAILMNHPAVVEAVAALVKDPDNRSQRLLAAYAKPRDADLDEATLREHLARQLPETSMPNVYVLLDEIPRLINGKVDRKSLPAPATRGRNYVAPRDAREGFLLEVWADALKKSPIGIHDRFFDLGGQSLIATQIVSRIQKAFDIPVPLTRLFESPTVAQLSTWLEKQKKNQVLEPPTPVAKRPDVVPLSFAQRRLWFLQQMNLQSAAYNLPVGFRFQGVLSRTALEKALAMIVARHEPLRTRFTAYGGTPRIDVLPSVELPLTYEDLNTLSDPEGAARAKADTLIARPFDLDRAPLFRAHLMRTAPEEHQLVIVMHHMIADAWSLTILLRELEVLYESACFNKRATLSPLPLAYSDYAIWQEEVFESEEMKRQMQFWMERLENPSPMPRLPFDRPRPVVPIYQGAWFPIALPPVLCASLKQAANRENATLFMALLSGFKALLSRYDSQKDIAVGTPVANRQYPEIESLIGFFVNTLVLRTDLSGGITFKELLARVRRVVLDASENAALPFEKLVEAINPERALGHNPLFQVMFLLNNTAELNLELTGLSINTIPLEEKSAKFDLTFRLLESGEGVHGWIEYNTALFDEKTIRSMAHHYQSILTGAASDLETPIDRLPLTGSEDRAALLTQWNQTASDVDLLPVFQRIEAVSRQFPNHIAVHDADTRITYVDLVTRAKVIGSGLSQMGTVRGDVVAVCMPNRAETVIAILGVLERGATYLPLSPDTPEPRLREIIADSGARILITDVVSPGLAEDNIFCRTLAEITSLAGGKSAPAVVSPDPEELVYIIYTSGSTGKPKGVMLTHGNLSNYLHWCLEVIQETDGAGAPVFSSLAFDLPVTAFYPPLIMGQTLFIFPEEPGLDQLIRMLGAKPRLSMLKLTPSHLDLLQRRIPTDALAHVTQLMVLGGEALTAERIAFWRRHSGDTRSINEYGPTETTVAVAYHEIPTTGTLTAGEIPIGLPIPNLVIHLLDKHLEPVPPGFTGAIYVGGAGLARGYFNRPALTATSFIPDPFTRVPGERLYHTGDLAYRRRDGNIVFMRRSDFQIKIRGHRIETGEIEACLDQSDCVRKSLVLAHEANAGQYLIAYVEREPGSEVDEEQLLNKLRKFLPGYMIPSRTVFVSSWPLNRNGKIDRKALPAPTPPENTSAIVLPRNQREQALVGIWSELTGQQPGIRDNFFDSGGHSMLAMQLVSRIRERFGIDLSPSEVFTNPTVSEQASFIEQHQSYASSDMLIVKVEREALLPTSFAQQRIWTAEIMNPDDLAFNVGAAVRLKGKIDIPVLRRCFQEISERHEILRTRFVSRDGAVFQKIEPAGSTSFTQESRHMLSDPAALQKEITREISALFNLENGPLWRQKLIDLEEEDHVLILSLHHIVTDGWSMGVLIRELNALYAAFSRGCPSPLTPLPVQYADYAAWQQRFAGTKLFRDQLKWWKDNLFGAPVETCLPTDYPRTGPVGHNGARVTLAIDEDITRQLRDLSRHEDITLFMMLSASVLAATRQRTRQDDMVIGVNAANRAHVATEDLIGYFINQLAIRVETSASLSFRQLMISVREAFLGAFSRSTVPFDRVVSAAAGERRPGLSPLFQIMVNYQEQSQPPDEAVHLPDAYLSIIERERVTANFELSVNLINTPKRLLCQIEYNTALFKESSVQAFAKDLEWVWCEITANPEIHLETLAENLDDRHRKALIEKNLESASTSRSRLSGIRRRAKTSSETMS